MDTYFKASDFNYLLQGKIYVNSKTNTTSFNANTITQLSSKVNVDDLNYKNEKVEAKKENRKENNKMKGFKFNFGPVNDDKVHMSMYGLAIKNLDETYVAYDAENDTIMDVEVFNIKCDKFFYKMPVPIKDVKKGDVVVHNRRPMFVLDYGVNNKSLIAVDPMNGEKKEIMMTHSPFGFDFATKVVSLMDMCGQPIAPSESNPFGNMWMLAFMDDKNDNILPLMMMAQGGNFNPMMTFMLMNKDSQNDIMPLAMMMMMNNKAT